MEHLTAERDEKECLEAFDRMKASIRIHGEHKQKVQLNVGLIGIQVIDELTKVPKRIRSRVLFFFKQNECD